MLRLENDKLTCRLRQMIFLYCYNNIVNEAYIYPAVIRCNANQY